MGGVIRGNGSYELVFEIGRILVKRVEERDKCNIRIHVNGETWLRLYKSMLDHVLC